MLALLGRLRPGVALALAGSLLALTLLASHLYVIKRPLAEYRRLRSTRSLLEAEISGGAQRPGEIEQLSREVEALERSLQRGSQSSPPDRLVAHIVDQLDRISGHHEVQLVGVRPGKSKRAFMFEEVPFEVELTGRYFSLYDWLREVERELGPMVVKQYEVHPDRERLARMKLTMVSYQPAEEGS